MKSNLQSQFINFLHQELNLSRESITLALRQSENSITAIPMMLWQYGLVNLQQLDHIFDWLDTATPEVG
jgi:hypothetical protein